MPAYQPEDRYLESLILKDGDPAFKQDSPTLEEAIVFVRHWSEADRERARFKITGSGREYTWADLKPHIDHL